MLKAAHRNNEVLRKLVKSTLLVSARGVKKRKIKCTWVRQISAWDFNAKTFIIRELSAVMG